MLCPFEFYRILCKFKSKSEPGCVPETCQIKMSKVNFQTLKANIPMNGKNLPLGVLAKLVFGAGTLTYLSYNGMFTGMIYISKNELFNFIFLIIFFIFFINIVAPRD